MSEKVFCVYIITNWDNRVLYTGITSSLKQRIWQHKNKIAEGFASKYNCNKLVYYEMFSEPLQAIEREKQIKKFYRNEKVALVKSFNPDWNDLYKDL
ncbi:putative endonuclease [Elusimicrobium posterum]|uniref:GIY-YIG nuclease family protein n=1 Tax=Elusimicrobium posterum TaxID=3116653 RepID=UPI003C7495E6